MAIVNTLPETADYDREVIQKCMGISPYIADYLARQEYLLEVTVEEVTPRYLRQQAMSLLLGELVELGIIINQDEFDICNDVTMIQLAIALRTKFDRDNFTELIKDRQDLIEIVQEYVEEPVDALISIVANIAAKMPLDDSWDYINRQVNILENTPAFIEHIAAILTDIEQLGDPSVAETVDIAKVDHILQLLTGKEDMIERSSKLRQVTLNAPTLFAPVLKKLTRSPLLEEVASADDGSDTLMIPKGFKESSPVFFEYWEKQPVKNPSASERLCLVVMEHGLKDTKESLMVRISNKTATWGADVRKQFYDLIQELYTEGDNR